jgi:Spy/CpxP family protein refolding chaperone
MQPLKCALSALVLGTLLFSAPGLRADDPMDKASMHGHWDKFKLLQKKLDLTDDQVAQWKAAEKGQGEKAKLLSDRTKADLAELAVLVDENAPDADLKAGLKSLEADHREKMAREAKKIETMKGILTPMQQAKLVVMMFGGHKDMGGFRGHGEAMGGWPGGGEDKAGQDHGDGGMGQ